MVCLCSCKSVEICEGTDVGTKYLRGFNDFSPWSSKPKAYFNDFDSFLNITFTSGIYKIRRYRKFTKIDYFFSSKKHDLDSIYLINNKNLNSIEIVNKDIRKDLITFIVSNNDSLIFNKNSHNTNFIELRYKHYSLSKIYIYSLETYVENKILLNYRYRYTNFPFLFKKKCRYDLY